MHLLCLGAALSIFLLMCCIIIDPSVIFPHSPILSSASIYLELTQFIGVFSFISDTVFDISKIPIKSLVRYPFSFLFNLSFLFPISLPLALNVVYIFITLRILNIIILKPLRNYFHFVQGVFFLIIKFIDSPF